MKLSKTNIGKINLIQIQKVLRRSWQSVSRMIPLLPGIGIGIKHLKNSGDFAGILLESESELESGIFGEVWNRNL